MSDRNKTVNSTETMLTADGQKIPIGQVKSLEDFILKVEKTGYQPPDPEAPIPRLESVSETGLIRIVWDRKLIVPVDYEAIPDTQYVLVDKDLKI